MERKMGITDNELFRKLKKDDTKAYEMLFHRHWHALFHFSLKILHSEDEAKDITQSVFLYLWDKRYEIQINESVKSYLFQAVRFRSLNRIKELLNTPQNIEDIPAALEPVLEDIMEAIDYKELRNILENEVSNLPERTQEIFRLSRFKQLSVKEIAQQLNISEQTVKNQITKALGILRKNIAVPLLLAYLKMF